MVETETVKREELFLGMISHTREDKKSFTTTILPKQNISVQSITHHAYLWLFNSKSAQFVF